MVLCFMSRHESQRNVHKNSHQKNIYVLQQRFPTFCCSRTPQAEKENSRTPSEQGRHFHQKSQSKSLTNENQALGVPLEISYVPLWVRVPQVGNRYSIVHKLWSNFCQKHDFINPQTSNIFNALCSIKKRTFHAFHYSISSMLYARFFCTNFFAIAKRNQKSCQNDVRAKNSYVKC